MKKIWLFIAALFVGSGVMMYNGEEAQATPSCSIIIDRRPSPDRATFQCSGSGGYVQAELECYTSPYYNLKVVLGPVYRKGANTNLTFSMSCPSLRPYMGDAHAYTWGTW